MTDDTIMRFYLEPSLCKSALAGQHNFIAKVAEVLNKSQYRVEYHEIDSTRKADVKAHSLIHMKQPVGPRGLVFRRVYHYPFWQIERTQARWDWEVAKATFDPATVEKKEALRFYQFWQNRLFEDAPQRTDHEGFLYVPLQGRLLEHRSFQSCSPVQMIEHCLQHDPNRQIIATLHPKETYSHAELAALERMQHQHARLEIRKGEMVEMLQGCDYVVTQNSSAAFSGLFFGKPALLFAKIDFHHIAIKADPNDLSSCFEKVAGHKPDYAAFIWWFWQGQSINAGRPDAEAKIADRLRQFGWPIK